MLTTHLHAASFGVGGRLVDARNEEFVAGQVGNDVEPAAAWEGSFGPVTLVYWAAKLVKSVVVETVLPETVTMPKEPASDCAGK